MMSTVDTPIHQHTHSFETALRQLLHTAQANECDPQGTYTLPLSARKSITDSPRGALRAE